MTDTPNPVDLHVGARVRARRKLQGVSQEKLADALKLTFQQVQKYERGANRISASKLWDIGKVLGVAPAYFFEGLDPASASGQQDDGDLVMHEFLMTAEGVELATRLPRIRQAYRRRVLELVRTLDEEPALEAA